MWNFETEPAFQAKLDWMTEFVREEIEPIDVLWGDQVYIRPMDPALAQVVGVLKNKVRQEGLWACHLGQSSEVKVSVSSSWRS